MYLKSRDIKKTRKTHRCYECDRIIKAGETCLEESGVDSGVVHSWYTCDVCIAFKKYMRSDAFEDNDIYEFFSDEMRLSDIEEYAEFAATFVLEQEITGD